jgi:hypothetical protein
MKRMGRGFTADLLGRQPDAASASSELTMIHIATSADLGRAVRRGLREAVLFSADNWLVGPCSSTPEVHLPLRCDHWGLEGRQRAQFLRSFQEIMKAIDSPERIALWVSRQGSDTVGSWALCAWRLLRYPSQPNLDLVLVGSPAGQEDPVGLGSGSVRVTPADARRGLDQACSLSLAQVRRMARSWRRLSDRSPILAREVDDVVRKDKPLFELGTYQSSFFPRLQAGHLVLSRFDELLFACLEDRGSTPADVFLARGAAGEELRRRWLAVTGDVFLSIGSRNGPPIAGATPR